LHPKPVDFGQDPLALGTTQSGRKSFDANLAISTILFERSSRHFHDVYSTLKKLRHHRLAFSAYPLSGGFERPFFIPTWMMRPVLTIEHVLRALSPSLSHPRRVGAGISLRRFLRKWQDEQHRSNRRDGSEEPDQPKNQEVNGHARPNFVC
jgi:hypothetical protein